MRSIRIITAFAMVLSMLASCGKDSRPYKGEYSSVLLYYGMGYNNLSGDLDKNIKSMISGDVPSISSDKALLIFNHGTARYGDYSTPSQPTLTHVYRKKKEIVCDTLVRFGSGSVSASGTMLRSVLQEVGSRFPSKGYGLMLSSHSTGWIPPGYETSSENTLLSSPLSIGAQFNGSQYKRSEIETAEFAAAFPMKMDYIIIDACLSSCIEIAYQLRDVCGSLVASPTEVLTTGFIYQPVCKHLLSADKPDLKSICTDYIDYYNSLSGSYRSATVAIVDCKATEKVADVCASIYGRHRDGLRKINRNLVQKYFYNSLHWFYDLRDLAAVAGAEEDEMAKLDSALEECVLYHAETPSFMGLKLDRCCGLSVYIPDPAWSKLNSYYKTLDWNKKTGLVE